MSEGYNCEICNFHSGRQSNWKRHLKTPKHKKNVRKYSRIVTKTFDCSLCDYTTNRKFNLKKHLAKIHKLPSTAGAMAAALKVSTRATERLIYERNTLRKFLPYRNNPAKRDELFESLMNKGPAEWQQQILYRLKQQMSSDMDFNTYISILRDKIKKRGEYNNNLKAYKNNPKSFYEATIKTEEIGPELTEEVLRRNILNDGSADHLVSVVSDYVSTHKLYLSFMRDLRGRITSTFITLINHLQRDLIEAKVIIRMYRNETTLRPFVKQATEKLYDSMKYLLAESKATKDPKDKEDIDTAVMSVMHLLRVLDLKHAEPFKKSPIFLKEKEDGENIKRNDANMDLAKFELKELRGYITLVKQTLRDASTTEELKEAEERIESYRQMSSRVLQRIKTIQATEKSDKMEEKLYEAEAKGDEIKKQNKQQLEIVVKKATDIIATDRKKMRASRGKMRRLAQSKVLSEVKKFKSEMLKKLPKVLKKSKPDIKPLAYTKDIEKEHAILKRAIANKSQSQNKHAFRLIASYAKALDDAKHRLYACESKYQIKVAKALKEIKEMEPEDVAEETEAEEEETEAEEEETEPEETDEDSVTETDEEEISSKGITYKMEPPLIDSETESEPESDDEMIQLRNEIVKRVLKEDPSIPLKRKPPPIPARPVKRKPPPIPARPAKRKPPSIPARPAKRKPPPIPASRTLAQPSGQYRAVQANGKTQYVCDVCKYSTDRESNMKRHIKSKRHLKNLSKLAPSVIKQVATTKRVKPVKPKRVPPPLPTSKPPPIPSSKPPPIPTKRIPVVSSGPTRKVRVKGKTQYVCDVCKYSTDRESNLKRHLKSKRHLKKLASIGQNVVELVPPVVASKPAKLAKLIKRTTPPIPARIPGVQPSGQYRTEQTNGKPQYVCDVCKYNTDRESNMKRHLKSKRHLKKLASVGPIASEPKTAVVSQPKSKTKSKSKKKTKISKKPNPWMEHLKAVREANPDITYKEAMSLAKQTYQKKKKIKKKVFKSDVSTPHVSSKIEKLKLQKALKILKTIKPVKTTKVRVSKSHVSKGPSRKAPSKSSEIEDFDPEIIHSGDPAFRWWESHTAGVPVPKRDVFESGTISDPKLTRKLQSALKKTVNKSKWEAVPQWKRDMASALKRQSTLRQSATLKGPPPPDKPKPKPKPKPKSKPKPKHKTGKKIGSLPPLDMKAVRARINKKHNLFLPTLFEFRTRENLLEMAQDYDNYGSIIRRLEKTKMKNITKKQFKELKENEPIVRYIIYIIRTLKNKAPKRYEEIIEELDDAFFANDELVSNIPSGEEDEDDNVELLTDQTRIQTALDLVSEAKKPYTRSRKIRRVFEIFR
jgi:hypothetical protein